MMELLLDTVNLEQIEKFVASMPIAGVTSNPSIIKQEGKIDFFNHMKKIREIIGFEKTLHVQVVATNYEGILADAKAIKEKIDPEVYIKIPINDEGLHAIKTLKAEGYNITGTAMYTKIQGLLAISAGADFIAPYFNRMENQNIDSFDVLVAMSQEIERTQAKTKILAASFKNIRQVTEAFEAGAQAATVGTDIVKTAFAMPSINQAVVDFNADWASIYGDVTIAEM